MQPTLFRVFTNFEQELVNKVINILENGELPWDVSTKYKDINLRNASTGKPYSDKNYLNLITDMKQKGYDDPRFCTEKQALREGWSIKKDQKPSFIEVVTTYDKSKKQDFDRNDPTFRAMSKPEQDYYKTINCVDNSTSYPVYNAKQIEGIPSLQMRARHEIQQSKVNVETIAKNFQEYAGVSIQEDPEHRVAKYNKYSRTIIVPPKKDFDDVRNYDALIMNGISQARTTAICGNISPNKDTLIQALNNLNNQKEFGGKLPQVYTDIQKLHSKELAKEIKTNPELLFTAIHQSRNIFYNVKEYGNENALENIKTMEKNREKILEKAKEKEVTKEAKPEKVFGPEVAEKEAKTPEKKSKLKKDRGMEM